MCLFDQYKKKTVLNLKDDEDNFSTKSATSFDFRKTHGHDIIEEVIAEEKDNDGNYDDNEGKVAVQIVTHSTAIDSFTTSITWAEENGVDACDILVLKRLHEKVLKASFQTKNKRKLIIF